MVWTSIGKKILGSFVINIEDKDKSKVIDFLNKAEIEWREIKHE